MNRLITDFASVGILVIIFGTIYGTVQQAQRNDANYPQIQIAKDKAAQIDSDYNLRSGYNPQIPQSLVPVDMRTSLAPFMIVYDKNGQVVSSSGYLNGKTPKAPLGILTDAKGKEYNAVTWEPQKNVRIAAVTVAAKDYYVLSGRSLTEVEKNESETFKLAFMGGVLSLLVLGTTIVAKTVSGADQSHLSPRSQPPSPPTQL
jgi:hypothetical protein